ncbi:ABC transporter permease [Clostridium sp. DL1XJH146]
MKNNIKNKFNYKNFVKENNALFIFILLFIFAAINYDVFLSKKFVTNLILQNTMIGFLAIGMTFVIIAGGIDLSVGPVLALVGVVAARLSSYNILIVIVACVGLGILLGLLNGFLVVKLKIVPFIATLSTMIGIRGYIHLTTGSKSVPTTGSTDAFKAISKGEIIPGLPNAILIFVIVLIVGIIVLKYTKFGRHLYAVGGNEDAARMMGINVNRTTMVAYAVSGMMAAISGIVMTSRLGSGQYTAGDGWEMYAIASAVIGGTLITGGKGKLQGTLFGVLILGIIRQIFNLQGNLNTWWQNIATGAILLIVVIVQSRSQKKKA